MNAPTIVPIAISESSAKVKTETISLSLVIRAANFRTGLLR